MPSEIAEKLKDLSGWEYRDNKLVKTFEFPTFNDGLVLVNTLASFCNQIDHHPLICIDYKKITFSLTTNCMGEKVSEKDVRVAQEIEDLYGLY